MELAIPVVAETGRRLFSATAAEMATYFLDSSALVKRYVQETGSSWAQAITDPTAGHNIFIVRLTLVEITSAITRRGRGGTIPLGDVATILGQFRGKPPEDLSSWMSHPPSSTTRPGSPSDTPSVPMTRSSLPPGLDLQQQSLAAGRGSMTFLSADIELNLAAAREGLAVDDPNGRP